MCHHCECGAGRNRAPESGCRLLATFAVEKSVAAFVDDLFGFCNAMFNSLFAAGVIVCPDKLRFPGIVR